MGSPIEVTVLVDESISRRRVVEKEVRGLLELRGYDAYVDTVNLPKDEIELTIEVASPSDAAAIRQKVSEVYGVAEVT